MKPDEIKRLTEWLARQGAEVLAPTSQYEVVRFKAHNSTHIIYRRANGRLTITGFARLAIDAFNAKRDIDMGVVMKNRTSNRRRKVALWHRDGNLCFYCAKPMAEEDMTAEHLVSLDKGGPNHIDNMALAHAHCNTRAGNLPLVKKIERYCEARKAQP